MVFNKFSCFLNRMKESRRDADFHTIAVVEAIHYGVERSIDTNAFGR